MKVDIITFHFVNNFGSALQTYIDKTFNAEVEIIGYKNGFIKLTDTVRLFPITKSIKQFFTGIVSLNKCLKTYSKV